MASSVIGALRVNLGIDTAAFSTGLKKSESSLASFGKKMAKIGAAISAVGAGVAVGIQRNLTAIDDIGKAAQKIGIPVDELSRLAYAADLSGVSMEKLQTGVGRLSRQMNDARAGTAEAVDAFAQVGVAATDSEGNLRPATEVLADIAERFKALPDGAEKTALSMELMGRSGAELIPLLNGGADALRAMTAEADSLGIVITPEMFKNAEAFNDNLTRLKTTMGGLGTQITAELAPVLLAISNRVVDLSKIFRDLSPGVKRAAGAIAGLTVVLGPVIAGLGLLAIAIAAIGGPITILIAAVAAAGVAVVAFWDTIKLGPAIASEAFGRIAEAMEGLGFAAQAAASFVKAAFVEAFAAIVNDAVARFRGVATVINLVGSALDLPPIDTTALDGLTKGAESAAGALRQIGEDQLALAKFSFESAGRPLEALNQQAQGIETVTAAAQAASDAVSGLDGALAGLGEGGSSGGAGKAKAKIKEVETDVAAVETATERAGDALGGLFTSAIKGADDFKSALSGVLDQLAQMLINQAFKTLIGGTGFGAVLAGIPGFANGTNFAPGGLALVGERGPELVNLPRGSRVTPNGEFGGGSKTANININVSGARGNAEISEMVAAGVNRGLAQVREVFADSVVRVNGDPRMRGAF